VNLVERNILTVQDETFGLGSCILHKHDAGSLPPHKGIILAYLIVEVLRGYATSEWAWLNKDPGAIAHAFQRAVQLAQEFQFKLEDNGQLAKDLQRAAWKVEREWDGKNAVKQAFLFARWHLIRDIRLLVDEIFPLTESKKISITNNLSSNLVFAFDIKTHKRQGLKKLHDIVRQDRQRNDPSFKETDPMLRPLLQNKITILARYPYGNAALHPVPDSRVKLPSYRILATPQELLPTSLPYLNLSDVYPSDLLNRY